MNSSLWPVITQLERAAGYSRDDTASAKLDRLEELLRQASEPLAQAVPPLAELLGLPLDGRYAVPGGTPQERKARIFTVLLAQLDGLAHQRPVLVVLEDAHWLDPTTTEFFDRFADRIRRLPVLFVATFRPEAAPPWASYPHATLLSLNRLGRSGCQALIERTAGARPLPPVVVEAILSRTEGVPLFVEELTKTFLESGILKETTEHGSLELDGALPPLAIPATLQDSLMARLDRRAPTREVAQVAACIGREFDEAIVGAVADLSERKLAEALDQLSRAELIQRRGTPPRHVYAFKHALVCDAAYATLLKPRRQQLHARIAAALERLRPEVTAGQPEILAHHFIEGGLSDRGAAYLLAAGRLAKARNAIREATSQLKTCLRLVTAPRGETAPTIRQTERECLSMLGDLAGVADELEQANDYYERAAALADTDADRSDAHNRMHRVRYAERNGARLAYYEHGSGEPTIVFVNPIFYGLSAFQPVIEQLCQDFRVITVDCRGTGRSDALVGPYSTFDHMEDLAAIIRAATTAPVVGVGFSRGSKVFLQLAHKYPTLVVRLTLVGTPLRRTLPDGDLSSGRNFRVRRQEALDRGSLEEFIDVIAASGFSQPDEAELLRFFAERWHQLPIETKRAFFLDPDPGGDVEPVLASLSLPVLVAHGREDQQTRWPASEYIASRIPGAQLYYFERRGHQPLFSATDEFCRVLRNFIRTGRADSGS